MVEFRRPSLRPGPESGAYDDARNPAAGRAQGDGGGLSPRYWGGRPEGAPRADRRHDERDLRQASRLPGLPCQGRRLRGGLHPFRLRHDPVEGAPPAGPGEDDGAILRWHGASRRAGWIPRRRPAWHGGPLPPPRGRETDIVTNAFNGFPVSDGEEFLAFFRAIAATKPGSPKPTPLDKFLGDHPKALKVATAPKPVPASFVTEPYFAVHAFRFTNAEGKSRFGRYRFLPVAGAKFLTAEEAAKKGPNFLIDELTERLAKGPAAHCASSCSSRRTAT